MKGNVYIIGGFLGSGKTTLIHYLLSTCLAGKKIVVVENESGHESVDGRWLRSRHYIVRELTGGCLCCTLRLELPRVLAEIRQTLRPDAILIEPSGLASLEALLQIPGCPVEGAVTLIDVARYHFLMQLNPAFYRRQFRLSPVVFLTQTEQADAASLEKIKEELRRLSPEMEIVDDYRRLAKEEWAYLREKCRYTDKKMYFSPEIGPAETPSFEKQTLYVQAPIDIPFYVGLFNRINERFTPSVLRLKGVITDPDASDYKVEAAGHQVSVQPIAFSSGHRAGKDRPAGFLSVYREKAAGGPTPDWLVRFVNATETVCPLASLELADEELYRYIGFRNGRPDDYMQRFIARLKQEALAICRPRFGYRLVSGGQSDRQTLTAGGRRFTPGAIIVNCLKKSDFYAILLASAGTELQAWIDRKRAGKDQMEAFVADAIGSLIVEAVVARGLSLLEKEMASWNFRISNSYSPGYCGWNVAEQSLLFSLLPPSFCGITLCDSCLMLPIKSVSALVGIGEDMVKRPYGCAICRKKDCYKRKEVEGEKNDWV